MRKNVFREVPDVVHNAVLNALDSLEDSKIVPIREKRDGKRMTMFRMPRIAAIVLACFLMAGITASAVGVIGMINLHRQRMEEMDETEVVDYYYFAQTSEMRVMNRPYTNEERARYAQLKGEYQENRRFPESQLRVLPEGCAYDGIGVALDMATNTLCLPEEDLTDEEILELVDFHRKVAYSIYRLNRERIINAGGWESRMALMDDAEVDRIYLIIASTLEPTSGGYGRMLTADEESRYEELSRRYEEEGLCATSEMAVLWKPEEYDGEGVAVCIYDAVYYLPEREMSDEELLQLIDFQHKEMYCFDRIGQEIMLGLRDGYPPLVNVFDGEDPRPSWK